MRHCLNKFNFLTTAVMFVAATFVFMACNATHAADGNSPFPEGYFYMTVQGHDGLALESGALKDNGVPRPTLMAKRDVTGMAWKAIDAGDGYYFLTTQLDETLFLEGGSFVAGGEKGGGAEMNNRKATGQMWKVQDNGDGSFGLHSRIGGDDQFLLVEPNADAVPFMADGTGTASFRWVFVPME